LGRPGAGVNGQVYALAIRGNDLYVGGQFTSAGGVNAPNIAKWDGTKWSALATSMPRVLGAAYVKAIAVTSSDVFIGGNFNGIDASMRRILPSGTAPDGRKWATA
jgi:hypothetical protein